MTVISISSYVMMTVSEVVMVQTVMVPESSCGSPMVVRNESPTVGMWLSVRSEVPNVIPKIRIVEQSSVIVVSDYTVIVIRCTVGYNCRVIDPVKIFIVDLTIGFAT